MRRNRDPYEFDALAIYNSEKARGIVHTPEWNAAMQVEQVRFNEQRLAEAQRNGWIIVGLTGQPPA